METIRLKMDELEHKAYIFAAIFTLANKLQVLGDEFDKINQSNISARKAEALFNEENFERILRRTLVRTPNHGYGIIQDISEITGGRVTLGPGTLYGAINSMLTKGWLSLYSEDKESRKKKEYLLTRRGMEVFQNEV